MAETVLTLYVGELPSDREDRVVFPWVAALRLFGVVPTARLLSLRQDATRIVELVPPVRGERRRGTKKDGTGGRIRASPLREVATALAIGIAQRRVSAWSGERALAFLNYITRENERIPGGGGLNAVVLYADQ